MNEKSVSTLGRIASVLGVASKHTKTLTPIETILRMQHFQIWGFILMILAVAIIIWLVQKKLDSIDKQYKEQFILLHRLFKSHQDLQVKVHKNNQQQPNVNNNSNNNNTVPVAAPNVFIPVQQPQVIVLETVKEESSSVHNDNDDDTSSVATVETLGTVESNVESNESDESVDNDDNVNQKKIENDDSLPDMFN